MFLLFFLLSYSMNILFTYTNNNQEFMYSMWSMGILFIMLPLFLYFSGKNICKTCMMFVGMTLYMFNGFNNIMMVNQTMLMMFIVISVNFNYLVNNNIISFMLCFDFLSMFILLLCDLFFSGIYSYLLIQYLFSLLFWLSLMITFNIFTMMIYFLFYLKLGGSMGGLWLPCLYSSLSMSYLIMYAMFNLLLLIIIFIFNQSMMMIMMKYMLVMLAIMVLMLWFLDGECLYNISMMFSISSLINATFFISMVGAMAFQFYIYFTIYTFSNILFFFIISSLFIP